MTLLPKKVLRIYHDRLKLSFLTHQRLGIPQHATVCVWRSADHLEELVSASTWVLPTRLSWDKVSVSWRACAHRAGAPGHMGSRDSNSDPHTCKVSTLPIESSFYPFILVKQIELAASEVLGWGLCTMPWWTPGFLTPTIQRTSCSRNTFENCISSLTLVQVSSTKADLKTGML